uniref:5'-3' exoribonuclease 1 n=1 Tax=Trichuris muris TaxID=70415 RepID=A0A5S6R185_TRIMR
MGIPKFAWLLFERYPSAYQLVCDMEIPQFDNLYLDMNGIIHNCTHDNNNEEVSLERPEADVLKGIFSYVEMLFRVVKPKKVFYMAVDGVAPRGKMNQQRSRRFMSAKNAELALSKVKEANAVVSVEGRFDSNCITPGTVFMDKLHNHLKYFVNMKMSTDPLWQGVQVIYSGHDCPGEGEHKIMAYIRYIRSQPDYDPTTRHCLYGLDADLIILGLVSHEPYFTLLREEVIYRSKRKTLPKSVGESPTKFYMLHVSLLREYIGMEFSQLRDDYPDLFNLERLIDDWVLMACLLGNDFVPHLANFHTHENILPTLCTSYMAVFGKMQGYVNESGRLNLPRLELYFEKLSEMDRENFSIVCESLAEPLDMSDKNVMHSSMLHNPPEFWSGCSRPLDIADCVLSNDFEEEWSDDIDFQFLKYRVEYYAEKLGIQQVERDLLVHLKLSYIKALQWILCYYYEGLASWEWFYPYHYSPFVTDLRGFQSANLEFVKGSPLLPFQQLLAVLPPASSKLIPRTYRDLMINASSPIVSFYPEEFEIDLNGKRNDWESVVKLPFIDVPLLLSAMKSRDKRLSADERRRNQPGCYFFYKYDRNTTGQVVSSTSKCLPTIKNCKVKCTCLPIDLFDLPAAQVVHGLLLKEASLVPHFPTFSQLSFENKICCIHPRASALFTIHSVVLSLRPGENAILEEVATELLGKWVMVKWPHCVPALCVAVSSRTDRYFCRARDKLRQIEHQTHDSEMQQEWTKVSTTTQDELYYAKGIDTRECQIMVHCYLPNGLRYLCDSNGNPKVMFSWKLSEDIFPYTTIVPCDDAKQYFLQGREDIKKIFPLGSVVFSMAASTYGLQGEVVRWLDGGKVRVHLKRAVRKSLCSVVGVNASMLTNWFAASQLARDLGVQKVVVSRLTGTVPLYEETANAKDARWKNIGFNLKLTKVNMEMTGYARKDDTGFWTYSAKVRDYLSEYKEKFPEVFELLATNDTSTDKICAADLWTEDEREKRIAELFGWLKELPFHSLKWQPCGTTFIKNESIPDIERAVRKMKKELMSTGSGKEMLVVDMKTEDIHCPIAVLGNWKPSSHKDHRLLDRVVCVRPGYSVPLGLCGTIIQLPPADLLDTTDMLVLFDEEFVGAFSPDSGLKQSAYYVPGNAVLNMSYGVRMDQTVFQTSSTPEQSLSVNVASREAVAGNSVSKEVRVATRQQNPRGRANGAGAAFRSRGSLFLAGRRSRHTDVVNEMTSGLTSLSVTDGQAVETTRPEPNPHSRRSQPENLNAFRSTPNTFYRRAPGQPPQFCYHQLDVNARPLSHSVPLPIMNYAYQQQGTHYFPLPNRDVQFQENAYLHSGVPLPYGATPNNPWHFGPLTEQPILPDAMLPPPMLVVDVDEVERMDALSRRSQGMPPCALAPFPTSVPFPPPPF